MTLNKETLDNLKAEHGSDIMPLQKSGVQVVLRPLTRPEFDRLMDQSAKSRARDEVPTIHMNNAVRDSLLWPSRDEFNAALEKAPGVGIAFASKLIERAGADGEAEEITFL